MSLPATPEPVAFRTELEEVAKAAAADGDESIRGSAADIKHDASASTGTVEEQEAEGGGEGA